MSNLARAVLLATLAAHAHAETRQLSEGLTLSIDNNGLHVVKGTQRARLVNASAFKSLSVDKAKRKVVVDVADNTCVGNTKHEWTFGQLDARLENWSAYTLYKKKDWKGAVAGFDKATKHDPTWRIAAYNLASAHQLAGDKTAAVAALAPWLASEPIATYVQVTSDPELAPLLDRPELAKLRSAQPGTAKVSEAGLAEPLFARERDLIAIMRTEGSGGGAQYEIDIQLWNAKTGVLVSSTTLVAMSDTRPDYPAALTTAGKKVVAERAPRIQKLLVGLGFKPAKIEQGTIKEHDSAAKMMAFFAKAKLGVVATPDVANALRGNTQVGSVKSSGKMMAATYFEEANAIVIKNQLHAIEAGCDAGPEIGQFVIPVKP
jgi:hypothetical protein